MSCCSTRKFNLYTLDRVLSRNHFPEIEIEKKILKLNQVSSLQWKEIGEIQGKLSVLYLKFKYGSSNTSILLGYNKGKLAHIQWIVPNRKLKKRYRFLKDGSFSIISCLTPPEFRGNKIYPSLIQELLVSDMFQTKLFWIWTSLDNLPSIRGIEKAGGELAGAFIQRRFLWGLISFIDFRKNNEQ